MRATCTWKSEDWSNESSSFNFSLKARDFQPILSGKLQNFGGRRLESVVPASIADSKSPNNCVITILPVEATVGIPDETLHWENATFFRGFSLWTASETDLPKKWV